MILQPEFGLFFWSTIIWIAALFLLKKLAWKPLLDFLEKEEQRYAQATRDRLLAKKKLTDVEQQVGKLLQAAKEKSSRMEQVSEATRASMLFEAKEEAEKERVLILKKARNQLALETEQARLELTQQLAGLVLQATEKILQEEMSKEKKQKNYLNKVIATLPPLYRGTPKTS